VTKAEEPASAVEDEGPAAWKLDTTLHDLRAAVDRMQDAEPRMQLEAIHDRLRALTEN
jgi:hypothetical protein